MPVGAIILCTKYCDGVLMYTEAGGVCDAGEKWPLIADERRIVICICDTNLICPEIPPELAHRTGTLRLRDYLLVCGSSDITYARTTGDTTRDHAIRALTQNWGLLVHYERSGPYEEFSIFPVPTELCPRIDEAVAIKMAGYVPPSEIEELDRMLRNLPDHVIDLKNQRVFPNYTANTATYRRVIENSGRCISHGYILPMFTKMSGGNFEAEIRLVIAGTIMMSMYDCISRYAHELLLEEHYPDQCGLAGGSRILVQMVYSYLVR